MLRIGLTGGSGSGKSTVAKIFASSEIKIIDTDAVYHSLVSAPSPCVTALAEAFGSHILALGGGIDRKKLASIVFEPSEAGKGRLVQLNEITHRYVRAECERLLALYEQENVPAVVLDVPLLFESGFDALCDVTIAVLSPLSLREKRIMARDGLDAEAAGRRLAAQPQDQFYREHADYLIDNDGDFQKLREQALALLQMLQGE